MSAMQQMASVGAQANVHKDSSHSSVMQSMTPDALLACGERWLAVPYSSFMLLFSTPACNFYMVLCVSQACCLCVSTDCTQTVSCIDSCNMFVYEHASVRLCAASNPGYMPNIVFCGAGLLVDELMKSQGQG